MSPLKIASFNTNSIRARMPIIEDWLESADPDLLLLQETKVQDKDFPVEPLEEKGYQVIYRGQKSYNGVAIISKHPLNETRKNLYDDGDEDARFLKATLEDVSIINVYVPQGFAVGTEKFEYKLRWLKDFLQYIGSHYDPDTPLLIAGDFNVAYRAVDVFDPEKYRGEVGFHPDEQAILQEYFDWGLVDIFRKYQPDGGHYTFWDYRIPNAFKRKMGWRIDYILATGPLAEKSRNAWIDTEPRIRPRPSDHTFLIAEFN